MKKLSICITHYDEDYYTTVKRLLESISIQQGIDFEDIEVVIVNDGYKNPVNVLPIGTYPFRINVFTIQRAGVSAARNKALTEASGEYVMFCDCDDMFLSVCGIYVLLKELESGEYDTMVPMFVEESLNIDKKYVYINHDNTDCTFIHGKVHRRQFLLDNDIWWNDALTIHEDSYFNCLCQRIAKPERVKRCDSAYYLWKYRKDSVCRRDKKYLLKTYCNMIDSNTALVEQFLKRGMIDSAKYYVTCMMFGTYYTLNKEEWLKKSNKKYKDTVIAAMKIYYKKYKSLLEETDELTRVEIIRDIKNRSYFEGLVLETFTFDKWLNLLK